jgi:hypothetical protein
VRLSADVGTPESLAAAQKILFRSGAVSYCALKLIEVSREIRDLFARIPLLDAGPMERVIEQHLQPLHRLLASVGVKEPEILSVQ